MAPPLLQRLQSYGLRRGFSGGSTPWLVLGMTAWGVRTIRRMSERKPEVLFREELKPGQRVVIANGRVTID